MNRIISLLFVCLILTITSANAQGESKPSEQTSKEVASAVDQTPKVRQTTTLNKPVTSSKPSVSTSSKLMGPANATTLSKTTESVDPYESEVVPQEMNLLTQDVLDSLIEAKIRTQLAGNTPEEEDKEFPIPLIVAILSLILACYAIWTVKKHDKSGGKEGGHRGNGHHQYDSQVSHENRNENYATVQYVMSLERKIDELSRKINSKVPVSQPQVTPAKEPGGYRPPVSPKPTSKRFFASQVQSDGFPISALSEKEDDYSFIVLNISSGKGSFTISTNPNSMDYVIRNFGYTAAPICQVREQVQSPTRIETVIPGQVKLEGNMWKVIAKATVKLL